MRWCDMAGDRPVVRAASSISVALNGSMAVTRLQSNQDFDALGIWGETGREDGIDAIIVRGDLRPKHG
jgi:hypothetical protein